MLLRRWLLWVLLAGLAGACGAASAQDMPGAKDYPGLKRFEGSTLVGYEVRNFDEVDFQTSTFKEFDLSSRRRVYAEPPLHLEGKLTRLWYEAPGSTRALEIYRNYVNELTGNGFETLYDSTRDPKASQWTNFLSSFFGGERDFIKNIRSAYVMRSAPTNDLRTGTFQKGNLTVRLIAISWPRSDPTYQSREGAYMAVDIMETEAMEQKMVVVTASEIEKSLTTDGKIAIYGIFFDFGKADVKPDSKPSLDQIADFLKGDTAVKLHVVGHTDSVGGFDSNLALSRRRAEAVSAALVSQYGIERSRLTSNATDEGRARNRRVELVLQ